MRRDGGRWSGVKGTKEDASHQDVTNGVKRLNQASSSRAASADLEALQYFKFKTVGEQLPGVPIKAPVKTLNCAAVELGTDDERMLYGKC